MAYNKTVMFFFQKPENYYIQDFVRKIRAEKNGYEYLTLYEELLIESLNKDGVLANFFDDKIVPYTTKELSIIFNHRETIIKNGLELFQKYKIVEKKDDGSYFIPDALKFTKRTTVGAQNKKKQRNNKKDKEEAEDICPTYIEQETNIKKEIEINNKINNLDSETNIQLNNKYNSIIEEIINYLNIKSNKNFTTNNDFVTNWIIELLDSGYTIDAFKVIHYELGINSRFHDFRDTHATRLIENGADIKAVSQRLGHSTIITTNKPFGKWHEIFNDVTLANAILDRLLHHSHIININGNSYRLKNKLKIDSESSEPIQN